MYGALCLAETDSLFYVLNGHRGPRFADKNVRSPFEAAGKYVYRGTPRGMTTHFDLFHVVMQEVIADFGMVGEASLDLVGGPGMPTMVTAPSLLLSPSTHQDSLVS